MRRSRARFATEGLTQDNINAYMTLYTALVTTAKAAAPFIPFMTESIYQNLVRSVDTVSYTHLDVYKRQAHPRTGNIKG